MRLNQLNEGPCDVAKPEEIKKMSGAEYDKYAKWKKDCEAEERTTPLSTKRLTDDVREEELADRTYTCVHAKKGKVVVKAKTSYAAVIRAAAHWGFANTNGIDAHLHTAESKPFAEEIYGMNKEDPNNPEVLIQGFGRLNLNQIEDSVIGKFKDLAKRSERRNPMEWDQIGRLLETSTLKPMVDAINDTYAELEKIRKAGGPKSRGIKPGYSNPLRD